MDLAAMARKLQLTAALLLVGAAACAQGGPQEKAVPCPAMSGHQTEVHAWIERMVSTDKLHAFLVRKLGKPSTCKASAIGEDDQLRKSVVFRWHDGTTLLASQSPPEISETVVRSPHDLSRISGLHEALREAATDKGLAIEWSAPVKTPRRGLVEWEYQDPDPGVNGIARLSYDKNGRLVSVSLSTAP
jgi:hypothetical protein